MGFSTFHIHDIIFRFNNYNYFWIPVVGPHVGMIVGAVLYQLFIGFHWPDDDDTPPADYDTGLYLTTSKVNTKN